MPEQTPSKEQQATALLRNLVKQWQCVGGTSACDLLDDTCDAAHAAGIVTPADIALWLAEDQADASAPVPGSSA